MRFKLLTIQGFATLTGILTTAIVCSSTLAANAAPVQTRKQAIDWQTDWFLYQVNPELNGRKLRSTDYRYIQEWNAIRKAVAQEMKPEPTDCVGDYYWELYDYDWLYGSSDPSHRHVSRSFDRIADAIFYSRYPKLAGTRILSPSSIEAQRWNAIRRAIITEKPCS